jgi:transcriptional regulator with XRE-family HTH domain
MKERLLEFLKNENKSSAQLAEEIGVQASGISHILSGRNNPSLDFVLKMLEKYKFLSTEWLLFGKGSMYKEARMQNLFDYDPDNKESKSDDIQEKNDKTRQEASFQDIPKNNITMNTDLSELKRSSSVAKIVWFYENNTFEEFIPGK